jgi:hypothetical protein
MARVRQCVRAASCLCIAPRIDALTSDANEKTDFGESPRKGEIHELFRYLSASLSRP